MSQTPASEPQRFSWAFPVSLLCMLLGIALGFAAALPSKQALSVGQLAKALGVRYWYFKVPPRVQGTELLFELVDGDKVVQCSGSMSGMEVGENLLVTLRQLEVNSGRFEATIHGKSIDSRFSIDGKTLKEVWDTGLHFAPDGESINEQPLILGSRKGSVGSPFRGIQEGDVLIRLVVK